MAFKFSDTLIITQTLNEVGRAIQSTQSIFDKSASQHWTISADDVRTIKQNNAIVASNASLAVKKEYCCILYAARELHRRTQNDATYKFTLKVPFVDIEHDFRGKPEVQFKEENDFLGSNSSGNIPRRSL